jgi:hypothetical protein
LDAGEEQSSGGGDYAATAKTAAAAQQLKHYPGDPAEKWDWRSVVLSAVPYNAAD